MKRLVIIAAPLLAIAGLVYLTSIWSKNNKELQQYHQNYVSGIPAEVKYRWDVREGFSYFTPIGKRIFRNRTYIIHPHFLSNEDAILHINRYGMRSREHVTIGHNQIRVLALGDSLTMAHYLPEEKTYPYLLQKNITAAGGKNSDAEIKVLNAGMPGIDLAEEYSLLTEWLPQVKPQIIILGLTLNDANHLIVFREIKDSDEYPFNKVLKMLYYELSRKFLHPRQIFEYRPADFSFNKTKSMKNEAKKGFYKTANDVKRGDDWTHANAAFNVVLNEKYDNMGFAWTKAYWDIIDQNMQKVKKLADQHNAELLVILFPSRFQVESELIRNEPQNYFKQVMDKNSLVYLDLLPSLRAEFHSTKKSFYFDYEHLNREGFLLVSKEIKSKLFKQFPNTFKLK
ncbi:MAG: hypothetical protein KC713_01905 [Candidatus Omnitrophica bacterium]|nr:hypothetical protein [Candidatus Omnitrophota bacterium]